MAIRGIVRKGKLGLIKDKRGEGGGDKVRVRSKGVGKRGRR